MSNFGSNYERRHLCYTQGCQMVYVLKFKQYIFWSSLEGFGMKIFGMFHDSVVYFYTVRYMYFMTVWYILCLFGICIVPVLVCCTKSNLATLAARRTTGRWDITADRDRKRRAEKYLFSENLSALNPHQQMEFESAHVKKIVSARKIRISPPARLQHAEI
jgi:hypothetical protein